MRIEALTFLRFFAALVVVVFHYGRGSALSELAHPLMISGSQMVTFFFVLSGFVLMVSHFGREAQSFRRFYLARLARIAPIYWVALALAYFALRSQERTELGDLALHASFLQSWWPGHTYQLNFPGWSVSVEAFFYASFPFLLVMLKRMQVSVGRLFVLGFLFWALSQLPLIWALNVESYDNDNRVQFAAINFLPINHLCSFVLGVAGGYAFVQRKDMLPKRDLGSLFYALGGFALVFCAFKFSPDMERSLGLKLPFKVSFFAPLFLLLIWTLARSDNRLTRALSARPLVLLGEASYSLYILQTPVLLAYRKFLMPKLGLSREPAFYVYLLILIATSILTLFLIERPGRRLFLKLGNLLPQALMPPKSKA